MTATDDIKVAVSEKLNNKYDNGFVIVNENVNENLIPALERLLPSSLPVLRRIQFDCAYPRPNACYVVSANLISPNKEANEPWITAYVDLFSGRETQVWVYSSLEAEVLPADDQDEDDEKISDFSSLSLDRQNIAKEQIWGLLQFIHRDLMPAYLSHLSELDGQNNEAASTLKDGEEKEHRVKVIPQHKAPAILLGTVHTGLMKLLMTDDSFASGNFRPGLKVHRYDTTPYVKYVFPSKIYQTSYGQSNPLPLGYYYGKDGLLPEHTDLVKSRTHIPREKQTLLRMPSVVIYSSNPSASTPSSELTSQSSPIAWGFLAFDGSLATLHVEPEHRGKGLAIALSKEIMRRAMGTGFYGSEAENLSYTHADVAKNNIASRRVMEKLGERGWRWTIAWTVIEVLD